MFRTRFARDIVAEFLPPVETTGRRVRSKSARKAEGVHTNARVIILCDGMPSIPRKQPLAEFLAAQGYWVFYPRYRGAWESGGEFLEREPHLNILDVIEGLESDIRELAFGKRFRVRAGEIFVIGGSFGGAAALLCALDRRVKKAIANCPVVDWAILDGEEEKETSNPSYAAYIREAWGNGYRLRERNWKKLSAGKFFNPMHHVVEFGAAEIRPKIRMFHAQDDPFVPWRSVEKFAKITGVRLKLFPRGGHLSTDWVVRKYWREIDRFFGQERRRPEHQG
jgi:pimeloyl-ACP methyl ester carboxylesterase